MFASSVRSAASVVFRLTLLSAFVLVGCASQVSSTAAPSDRIVGDSRRVAIGRRLTDTDGTERDADGHPHTVDPDNGRGHVAICREDG